MYAIGRAARENVYISDRMSAGKRFFRSTAELFISNMPKGNLTSVHTPFFVSFSYLRCWIFASSKHTSFCSWFRYFIVCSNHIVSHQLFWLPRLDKSQAFSVARAWTLLSWFSPASWRKQPAISVSIPKIYQLHCKIVQRLISDDDVSCKSVFAAVLAAQC